MKKIPRKTAIVLWLLAGPTLTLSLVRPVRVEGDRARQLPSVLGEFKFKRHRKITERHVRLLGTTDVTWRDYVDSAGNTNTLTAVFHNTNWKSIHPPNICVRGSGFLVSSDESVPGQIGDREFTVGRIRARGPSGPWVGLYAYVGDGWVTSSYLKFYWHHFGPALFRVTTPGFLVRVEANVGADGRDATEERLWRMLVQVLRAGESILRQDD